jgi:diazepam-binding inhibitor (GABA receptor modulator, acyl-CoA-binding protein)
MTTAEEFERAQADAKSLPQRPDNDTLLKLYALFKQGTLGDATGSRPGMLDLVGRAKYDAWQAQAGKPQQQAQAEYIAFVDQLRGA